MKSYSFKDKNKKLHFGKLLFNQSKVKVIDCINCNYAHLAPFPTSVADYKRDYYDNFKINYIDHQKKNINWWKEAYKKRYNLFENLLGYKGKILDIGCGPGFFLLEGKKKGWEVLGIEPSIKAAKYANSIGVKTITSSFDENIIKKLKKFDVVTIDQAIEHIYEPKETIKLIKKILNPKGLVMITAANDFSKFQEIATKGFGLKKWWVVPKEHINYFSHKSLQKLLVSNNFKIELLSSTFPIDIFLLFGENYIKNPKKGPIVHSKRKKFEFLLDKFYPGLKEDIYKKLSELGIGREIKIIGRVKKNKKK